MNFSTRAVGQQYPITVPGAGAYLVFNPGCIEIVVAVPNPDSYEKDAFKSGHPTKIGFCKHGRLAVLIIDFGDGFSFDVPFDAGLEANNMPIFDWNSESQMALTLIGVDTAQANRVFGMRMVTASMRVTNYMKQIIQEQVANPIAAPVHNLNVEKLYARYPTYKSLKAVALANDFAGGNV